MKSAGRDLFHTQNDQLAEQEAPLAARMRPRTLDEFVGQEHIVGPGRLLRRAIQADQLSSLIFYGPPGTGKTTLARIIANTTRAHFIAINAVLAGVNDIRQAIAQAQERRGMYGQRTILFVDEVHRFNKAQQDALLPWVENGTVILIGATTENPYFEVNKALVSRSRIFQLKPLVAADLYAAARQALADPLRGYGKLPVRIDEDALAHLVDVSNGDARSLLNALELAVETTEPDAETGEIRINRSVAEESIQRRAVLYDKEGDVHYDTISAFIKSLRGSDPDAALYWMARMVYAGEDPRFIFRRMIIFAGEDVGLADPRALQVVMAAAQAFDYVGLPEGRFHLAEAALYLATAPKSNSAFAFFDALASVEREQEQEVPAHLRDANRDKEGFGHGEGYLYPHSYRDHWVAQQYLPAALQGRLFYQPGDNGYEQEIGQQLQRRREAQLAAMMEEGGGPAEILTWSSPQSRREQDRWLQRAVSGASERLGAQRERLLGSLDLPRHALVLDANAGSGLLTWEALRRVPEGGVWSLAATAAEGNALREMAGRLPEIERPAVLQGTLAELPELLELRGEGEVRFDAIVGRTVLGMGAAGACAESGVEASASILARLLRPGGALRILEPLPRYTQRLYSLVDLDALPSGVAARLQDAEEAIYADGALACDEDTLAATLGAAGFRDVQVQTHTDEGELQVAPALFNRWFSEPGEGTRPTYRQWLARVLPAEEIETVRALYEQQLAGRAIPWRATSAYITATAPVAEGEA